MKLDFTTTSNVVARPAGDQISNTNTAPAFHVDLTNTTSTLYSTDVFSTNAVVAGVYYYPNGVVLIGGTAAIPANLNVQSLTVRPRNVRKRNVLST